MVRYIRYVYFLVLLAPVCMQADPYTDFVNAPSAIARLNALDRLSRSLGNSALLGKLSKVKWGKTNAAVKKTIATKASQLKAQAIRDFRAKDAEIARLSAELAQVRQRPVLVDQEIRSSVEPGAQVVESCEEIAQKQREAEECAAMAGEELAGVKAAADSEKDLLANQMQEIGGRFEQAIGEAQQEIAAVMAQRDELADKNTKLTAELTQLKEQLATAHNAVPVKEKQARPAVTDDTADENSVQEFLGKSWRFVKDKASKFLGGIKYLATHVMSSFGGSDQKKDNIALKSENGQLHKEIEHFQQVVKDNAVVMGVRVQELMHARDVQHSLETENTALKKQVETLTTERDASRKQCESLTAQLNAAIEQNKRLGNQFRQSAQKFAELQAVARNEKPQNSACVVAPAQSGVLPIIGPAPCGTSSAPTVSKPVDGPVPAVAPKKQPGKSKGSFFTRQGTCIKRLATRAIESKKTAMNKFKSTWQNIKHEIGLA